MNASHWILTVAFQMVARPSHSTMRRMAEEIQPTKEQRWGSSVKTRFTLSPSSYSLLCPLMNERVAVLNYNLRDKHTKTQFSWFLLKPCYYCVSIKYPHGVEYQLKFIRILQCSIRLIGILHSNKTFFFNSLGVISVCPSITNTSFVLELCLDEFGKYWIDHWPPDIYGSEVIVTLNSQLLIPPGVKIENSVN